MIPAAYSATAHPSLALVKYWGKLPGGVNIPATTSIAVTLDSLYSRVTVQPADRDFIRIDGRAAAEQRFRAFFDAVRARCNSLVGFAVESSNNFPTAAGLASSSSGFAALALACTQVAFAAAGQDAAGGKQPAAARHVVGSTGREDGRTRTEKSEAALSAAELSALARVGSGSAARAVFGGFTRWRRGEPAAEQLYPAEHWSELRVVVLRISAEAKVVSSRDAMERTRMSSPYFHAWVDDNGKLAIEAERALATRDLERLGETARRSYLRMFATMLGAEPPILYWLPATVEAIRTCEQLRREGVPAFETMDAGPQVKVITTTEYVEHIRAALSKVTDVLAVCAPGPDAALEPAAPVQEPPAGEPPR